MRWFCLHRTSVRTVDRDKLREKARQLQMKENLRLTLCARIQQTLKKSPKVAEELAGEIMRLQQQRGLGFDLSDSELSALVNDMVARRQEQKQLASTRVAEPELHRENQLSAVPPLAPKETKSGRRSSSSSKERSGRRQSKPKSGGGKTSARGSAASPGAVDAADEETVYLTQSQLQQLSTGFRLPPKVSPKKDKGNGIWEEIVKFSSVEEQVEAERKKEAREQARRALSTKLDEQVRTRQQQLEAERRAASEYYHESMERLKHQEEEERRKEEERLSRAKQLTKIQDEQRRIKAQQLERERQIKKAQEQKTAEALKRQMEEDRDRERKRKEAEKDRIMRVLHENEEDMRRKQQLKDKEREMDLKLAEDYVKMEEAKEAARKKQLEDMANSVKARMKFFGDTAKAEMDAKAKEDEERVRKYQEEYDRQQAEVERKKREDALRSSLSQQEYLRLQIQEKKEREAALKRDLNKQAELWKQERQDAERRERFMKQQLAHRNRSQQEMLLQQIREKETRSLEADQTLLEVQLNAKLLEKIHKQVGNGASVVSETQNRSREVSEREFM
ncbi:hypothetical protein PINS_up015382 [Pythium insidiosum]|nr:hypothetical protein PINS_up015382 [Pythium insidiosum]